MLMACPVSGALAGMSDVNRLIDALAAGGRGRLDASAHVCERSYPAE
jgi:hypothetical protein